MKRFLALLFFLLFGASTANAQGIFGDQYSYDSGVVAVTATPVGTISAGNAITNLLTVPIARSNGGSGIITNFSFISSGGNTGQTLIRIWQKLPAGTTCTSGVPYAGNAADDLSLVTMKPQILAPAQAANVTGDAKAYGVLQNLTWDYKNNDTVLSKNLYVCLVTVSNDIGDASTQVTVLMSGTQN